MIHTSLRLSCFVALAAASGVSLAQPTADLGKSEFMSNCAPCHGGDAKGDGVVRQYLTVKPSDLTTLAKRNGGALPVQLVWEMIDGRGSPPVGAHGTRDMPIWGATYRSRAMWQPETAAAPEWYVRGRIVSLIDYLERIQSK